MNQETVSFIVPFYNAASYMEKTIPSYLSQTYDNIEFIFVNDGSSDDTLSKLKKYQIDDERIKVISTINQGLSAARNSAIDYATGDFVIFVDSDDYVLPEFVEMLVEGFSKHDDVFISAVGFSVIHEYDVNKLKEISKKHGSTKTTEIRSASDALTIFLSQKYNFDVSAWGKMFRREVFTNERFTPGILFEDLDILLRLFDDNLKSYAALSSTVMYGYFSRGDSIMNRPYNPNELAIVDVIRRNEQIAVSMGSKIFYANIAKSISALTGLFLKAERAKNKDADKLFTELLEFRKVHLLFKLPTVKSKILVVLLFTGRKVFSGLLQSVK